MRKLKAGVIGCGPIAQRGHLPALLRNPSVEIVAVADVDAKVLARVKTRFSVPKTFPDYHLMLDEKLDLVSVCVPNHLHGTVAIDAMKQGVNVLVEKPLAISVEEALLMVKTAEAKGVKLCEVKQWRYVPAVKEARELFSHGKLGRLVSMLAQWHSEIPLAWSHAQWYYDPEKAGGGIVSDIGSHMLDLLLLFGGPVARVSASGGDYLGTMGFDTSVQALLEFSSGGSGFLDVSWLAPYSHALNITGTSGMVDVDLRYYSLRHASHARNPFKDLNEAIRTVGRTSVRVLNKDFFNPLPRLYFALIDDFARAILNDHDPPVTGEMSVGALLLKEAIYKSVSEKRAITLS